MRYIIKDYAIIPQMMQTVNFPNIYLKDLIRKNKISSFSIPGYYKLSPHFFSKIEEKNYSFFPSVMIEACSENIVFFVSLLPKIKKFDKTDSLFLSEWLKKKGKALNFIIEELAQNNFSLFYENEKAISVFDMGRLLILNEENIINGNFDNFLLSDKSSSILLNCTKWAMNLRSQAFQFFFPSMEILFQQFFPRFDIMLHKFGLTDDDFNQIKEKYPFKGYILEKKDYMELVRSAEKKEFLSKYNNFEKKPLIRFGSYYCDDILSIQETPGYILV